MLRFFCVRELPGIEQISESAYTRGAVAVRATEGEMSLAVEAEDTPVLRARLIRMSDLEADRGAITQRLGLPNAFLPGSWCPFELAVRAVLGQQISMAAARTLAGRLVERTPLDPAAIACANLSGLGILPSRCKTLQALAEAASAKDFRYQPEQLMRLSGIGPWTAQYIAMRACKDADAFPAGDLILRRAAVPGQLLSERELLKHAERWRPYRAYASISLWTSHSTGTR